MKKYTKLSVQWFYELLEKGVDEDVEIHPQIFREVQNFQALRYRRLLEYLERRKPEFQINYSINVYFLAEEELDQALQDFREDEE